MDDGSRALLAVALVLLAVPIWAPALDITGQDFVYESTPMEIENGQLVVDAPPDLTGPDEQIDCMDVGTIDSDRRCRFEQVLFEGNLTVEPRAGLDGEFQPRSAEYVVFGQRGVVYERTAAAVGDGAYELGLQQVDPATALDRVSWGVDQHPKLRTAMETGQVRTETRVIDSRSVIVQNGDSYALVYESHRSGFLSAKPAVERAFEALLVALGAFLLFRAGRRTGREP